MHALEQFVQSLNDSERKIFTGLNSPAEIQAFLDTVPYSTEPVYRCPRQVLRDRLAHCFDGALFAAAALRRLGHAPRIIDMVAERDDDHLLAVYRQGPCWGAVAKSNFAGLRYREPVYRTLRELVMSYFELYYNTAREKTLRSYTVPLDLGRFDAEGWMIDDQPLERIADRLDSIRHVTLLTPAQARALQPVDQRSFEAGLLGSEAAGLYDPETA
ncbi:hypothetical protein DESUT3_33380 [Desulfuromonas versatilis]|uniref:Transglutaminase-like domain-containing protein n=1 Tax=Desulfuromonas versatilis TaxID=2802975 RepID=A0ABM8HWD1_9BACT|nr:hypothetical protein [Desulfuromonas versatilis]BCR06269.1 hypothetical protein DESUT3_33380 [Desulfuromonas versatilis]